MCDVVNEGWVCCCLDIFDGIIWIKVNFMDGNVFMLSFGI